MKEPVVRFLRGGNENPSYERICGRKFSRERWGGGGGAEERERETGRQWLEEEVK